MVNASSNVPSFVPFVRRFVSWISFTRKFLCQCVLQTVLALSNLYCSLMGDREKAHQILEENNLGDLR